MAALYELTGQMLQLQEILAEEEDQDQVRIVLDTIEGIEFEIELKAEGYAKIIRNLTADVEGLKTEIDRLANRKKSLENNISSLKDRLEDSMIKTGKLKFKTNLFSFGIQNNPASVVMDEQYLENIPEEYLIRQDPKVDRKKIKEDIQAGKDLSGIAHLEQSRSLRIR